MRSRLVWLLMFSALTVPCHASLIVYAGNCWKSDGTANFLGTQDCSIVSGSSTASTSQTITTPNPGNPNQLYVGSASVTASTDAWHLDALAALTDYLQTMYQYTTISGVPFVANAADARAVLTDGITVSGGTGVYSLSYVFSLDGTVTSSGDPDLTTSFCANLNLPQGQGIGQLTDTCVQAGQGVPPTFMLTYSGLAFGTTIDPTLLLDAAVYTPNQSPSGSALINGSASAHFGDTVTLTDFLITDSNGNPIPGITLTSQDGYSYPLDAANAVPEPSMLILLVVGGVFVFLYHRPAPRARTTR
jgi:hypothetical protein